MRFDIGIIIFSCDVASGMNICSGIFDSCFALVIEFIFFEFVTDVVVVINNRFSWPFFSKVILFIVPFSELLEATTVRAFLLQLLAEFCGCIFD